MSIGLLWILAQFGAAAADGDVATIREHLARGRYAEAAEVIATLPAERRTAADIMRLTARSQSVVGETAEALATLQRGREQWPDRADFPAEQARIHAQLGQYAQALAAVEAALAIDRDQPLARLVQADVWTATGDLRRASDGYRWFVRYYNQAQPDDAETLVILGRGAAQYARWRSVSQVFNFIVNTVCADALAADRNCWEAQQLAGELLLEKYNQADGIPELQAALATNPRAVEVLVTLAEASLEDMQFDDALTTIDKALAVNPRHPAALRVKAQIFLSQGELSRCEEVLQAALAVNPHEQRTLAVAAFVEVQKGAEISLERFEQLMSSLETIADWDPQGSPLEEVVVRLAKINPRPGYFLQDLGRFYQRQREFRFAEACYAQAIAKMPQLAQPKSDLGMLLFQAGRLDEARKYLDDAFQADPYHVRISNMRKVLRVLDGYATVMTPHFVIRADSELDGVLAKYMAEELEQVYTSITTEYGFEPPQRTQIEVYNKARGLAGHQWFSARMIGLPWLQTIGASTGLMIALTSPAATQEPYNWARVLRHEFVHVVTLQQTDFHIPHWFTEALATRSEGYPHPESWKTLLVKRFEAGNLKNLDNLHLGFQRAESREDWDFAYCQSVLYAEYFVERFGPDALPKLLHAYRDTRSTEVALKAAYGVEQADIEAGYLEFLQRRVATLKAELLEADPDVEAVTAAYAADPESLTNRAAYAQVLLRQRKAEEAEALATAVLNSDPKQPKAALVLAQIQVVHKKLTEARQTLETAYDAALPQRQVWLLLGQLRLKDRDFEPARALYERGAQVFPDQVEWWRGLAEAAEQTEHEAQFREALEQIARLDGDSVDARLKRAELALADGDYESAVRYARLALHVDVLDVDIHLALARGFVGLKQRAAALVEFDVALQLKPGDPEIAKERAAAEDL